MGSTVAVAPKYSSKNPVNKDIQAQRTPTAPRDYLFVSNVRFVSMAAVVGLHCIQWFGPLSGIEPNGLLSAVLIQPLKFGTIGFFLISGFLMGEGLTRRSPTEYIRRRIRTVFWPWLVWFSLFWIPKNSGTRLHAWQAENLLRRAYSVLFQTPYWFVPNLLLAICILLLCRRFLYDLRLGCVLLVVSVFYGLNIYQQWVPVGSHSQALFGFVFYLWLGTWAARNFVKVETWIQRIPTPALIAVNAVALCAAVHESSVLAVIRPSDDMDTLRLTNQFYAVSAVLTIVKARRAIWPRRIDVRATTFGIYLVHPLVYSSLWFVLHAVGVQGIVRSGALMPIFVGIFLSGCFIFTYAVSFALTNAVLRSRRVGWTVGASALRRAPDRIQGTNSPA